MDGEGPLAACFTLLDKADRTRLRRRLHVVDQAWKGVIDQRQAVQAMLSPPPVPPERPTLATTYEYWRRIYSDAANSGGRPTTARQARAVMDLAGRARRICGAEPDDNLDGSVETPRDAVRAIVGLGKRTWLSRKNPPTASTTIRHAWQWWHRGCLRLVEFDLPGSLVAAGEADSLEVADKRIKQAVAPLLNRLPEASLDASGSGDLALERALGEGWEDLRAALKIEAVLAKHKRTLAEQDDVPLACAPNDYPKLSAAIVRLGKNDAPAAATGKPRTIAVKPAPSRNPAVAGQEGGEDGGRRKSTAMVAPPPGRLARLVSGLRRWVGGRRAPS